MADNMTTHNVVAEAETPKRTKLLRYTEAKSQPDFDLKKFCGVILAEDIAKAKKAMSIVGKNWGNSIPFPKSDKAFDYIETELTEYLAGMLEQLRAGSTKVVANLEAAPF